MSEQLGTDKLFAYKLENVSLIISKIIESLIENSEDIWKVLKYDSPNALELDNLTYDEKLALIDKGIITTKPNEIKIKLVPFSSGQILNDAMTEIRILDYNTHYGDTIDTTQTFQLQILTHYTLWVLEGGNLRCNIIKKELISVLNQMRVDKVIGSLSFDNTNSSLQYWNGEFMGYTMNLHGIMG